MIPITDLSQKFIFKLCQENEYGIPEIRGEAQVDGSEVCKADEKTYLIEPLIKGKNSFGELFIESTFLPSKSRDNSDFNTNSMPTYVIEDPDVSAYRSQSSFVQNIKKPVANVSPLQRLSVITNLRDSV